MLLKERTDTPFGCIVEIIYNGMCGKFVGEKEFDGKGKNKES